MSLNTFRRNIPLLPRPIEPAFEHETLTRGLLELHCVPKSSGCDGEVPKIKKVFRKLPKLVPEHFGPMAINPFHLGPSMKFSIRRPRSPLSMCTEPITCLSLRLFLD